MTSESESGPVTQAASPDIKNLTTLPDKVGSLPEIKTEVAKDVGTADSASSGSAGASGSTSSVPTVSSPAAKPAPALASSASSGGSSSGSGSTQTVAPTPNAAIPGAVKPLGGNYKITSDIGDRVHPVHKVKKFHKGVDLAGVPKGTPVSSVLPGTVEFAGVQKGYGNIVIVKHPDGTKTAYAHLNDINVKKGESIQAGTNLGGMGNTGVGTGAHLHFEYRSADGKYLDPKRFI